MKNCLRIPGVFCLLASVLLWGSVSSCRKTKHVTKTGTFYLKVHTYLEGHEIDSTRFLLDTVTGHYFLIKVSRFFISGIKFQNANGATFTVPDSYILVNSFDNNDYLIGNVPIGTYTSVTFKLGLDAVANSKIPSEFTPAGSTPSSTMWFGNTSLGYTFLKLQGLCDTSRGKGSAPVSFSYEIGAARNLKTITMPIRGVDRFASFLPYQLTPGGSQYIHLICDYQPVLGLAGLTVVGEFATNSYDIKPGIADAATKQSGAMFKYKE